MPRLSILVFLICASLSAASWDGVRGDLEVATVSQIITLPWLNWTGPVTTIAVSSSDTSVTAFRVSVTVRNAFGLEVDQSVMVGLKQPAQFLGVAEDSILRVRITRLRDGETDLRS